VEHGGHDDYDNWFVSSCSLVNDDDSLRAGNSFSILLCNFTTMIN